MELKGNSKRYGLVAISLHWIAAAAIVIMFVAGFGAQFSDAVLKTALLRIHLPVGFLVLGLTIGQVFWRFFDRQPDAPMQQPRWQLVVARIVRFSIYLALLLMCSSGIALILQSGAAAVLFSGAAGPLPDFGSYTPMLVHAVLAFVLIGLACLHVGAALYHQIVCRDRLLSRMGIGVSD